MKFRKRLRERWKRSMESGRQNLVKIEYDFCVNQIIH